MQWKKAQKNDQGYVKIPKRWLYVHYYERPLKKGLQFGIFELKLTNKTA